MQDHIGMHIVDCKAQLCNESFSLCNLDGLFMQDFVVSKKLIKILFCCILEQEININLI